MTKQEIVNFLKSKGYIEYRLGCFAKEKPSKPIPYGFHHYRLCDKILKIEERTSYGTWIRLKAGYYGNLSINEHNKLVGMVWR